MRSSQGITAFFLILLVAVAGFLHFPHYRQESVRAAQLAAVLNADEPPIPIGTRTKEADCHVHGALPDRECSPGAIFPDAGLDQICHAGYTKTVRNVSAKTKQIVFAEYGISYPQPYGSYEVDHIIPLAIGGSNDIANLFPEAAAPVPGFREKDLVEVYLQEEACAGHIALAVAQGEIAHDWISIYLNLPEGTIARLKEKYRSWSN